MDFTNLRHLISLATLLIIITSCQFAPTPKAATRSIFNNNNMNPIGQLTGFDGRFSQIKNAVVMLSTSKKLSDDTGFCSGLAVRYTDDQDVEHDFVISAQHCLKQYSCSDLFFIRNFHQNPESINLSNPPSYQTCNRIAFKGHFDLDIAVFELNQGSFDLEGNKIPLNRDLFFFPMTSSTHTDALPLSLNDPLIIFHHPQGEPLRYSVDDCFPASTRGIYLSHRCDTLQGSSGAPIFNARTGSLVGFHNRGFLHQGKPEQTNADRFNQAIIYQTISTLIFQVLSGGDLPKSILGTNKKIKVVTETPISIHFESCKTENMQQCISLSDMFISELSKGKYTANDLDIWSVSIDPNANRWGITSDYLNMPLSTSKVELQAALVERRELVDKYSNVSAPPFRIFCQGYVHITECQEPVDLIKTLVTVRDSFTPETLMADIITIDVSHAKNIEVKFEKEAKSKKDFEIAIFNSNKIRVDRKEFAFQLPQELKKREEQIRQIKTPLNINGIEVEIAKYIPMEFQKGLKARSRLVDLLKANPLKFTVFSLFCGVYGVLSIYDQTIPGRLIYYIDADLDQMALESLLEKTLEENPCPKTIDDVSLL